eukprot:UN16339
MALLEGYFRDGRNVSDSNELCAVVAEIGLDREAAAQILADEIYSGDVRGLQQQWQQMGVTAVPSFIIKP